MLLESTGTHACALCFNSDELPAKADNAIDSTHTVSSLHRPERVKLITVFFEYGFDGVLCHTFRGSHRCTICNDSYATRTPESEILLYAAAICELSARAAADDPCGCSKACRKDHCLLSHRHGAQLNLFAALLLRAAFSWASFLPVRGSHPPSAARQVDRA